MEKPSILCLAEPENYGSSYDNDTSICLIVFVLYRIRQYAVNYNTSINESLEKVACFLGLDQPN
jgi:hypothetical protein